VPSRAVIHEDIGRQIAAAREQAGWSQTQAVSLAARRGLPLGLGALRGMEEGTTKYPTADVLRAIATLFRLPYEALVRQYTTANYGVDVDAPVTVMPIPSADGAALAAAFDTWSEARQQAFWTVAGLPPRASAAGLPPVDPPLDAPMATAAGGVGPGGRRSRGR